MPTTELDYQAVPIDDLEPYPGNARRGNIDLLADSLRRYGQYRPLVVQRGTMRVLAGNHTLAAAVRLGWTRVDATLLDCDDDTAARINLIDNRSNDVAGYDTAALAAQLAGMPDLEGTGWSVEDLAGLLEEINGAGEPEQLNDPDDVPELVEGKPSVSRPGDVWELGPHRLAVGDSTDPATWEALLGDEQVDAVWTDPPYGVSYVGKTKDALTIQNDALSEPGLQSFLTDAFTSAMAGTRQGACWYVASPPAPLTLAFGQVLHALGIYRQTIIWVKDAFVLGHSDFHYRHEPIYYGWTPGAAHHPPPDRKQDSVWEIPRPKRSKDHPTMKPVALIVRALENSSSPGDIIADPFGGSGSTLIACHDTKRRGRLIELDPRYADVICRRYQEHTGTVPVRNGQPVDFTKGQVAA